MLFVLFWSGIEGEIVIPSTVKIVDAYAFAGVASLTGVSFGEEGASLTIGGSAFRDSGLTSVVLTNRIDSIGSYSFYSIQVVEVTRTDEVIEGGSYMFNSNIVQNIYVPESLLETYKADTRWSKFADKISVKHEA